MLKPYVYDDDDWKASAMTHDSLVVDLLLNLKHTASRPICCDMLVAELAPASWGAKQPRSVSDSKSVSGCSRIVRTRNRRCSPSTPLSWSGGSGGGVDVCDTSSLPLNQSLSFRSKISLPVTEPHSATSSKHRKKKTYTELKVEEDILLRERIRLNQELAMLDAIVKQHIAENETLKRIKLSLNTQSMKNNFCNLSATSGPMAVSVALIPARLNFHAESDVIPGQKSSKLMLPDLNMMPSSELESGN